MFNDRKSSQQDKYKMSDGIFSVVFSFKFHIFRIIWEQKLKKFEKKLPVSPRPL